MVGRANLRRRSADRVRRHDPELGMCDEPLDGKSGFDYDAREPLPRLSVSPVVYL